ncbi:MAG TPA: hypothetical protein VLM38_22265 [Blastocatellia bacterium]|nr:hypothetical protein [Blastocatellia bacterium]
MRKNFRKKELSTGPQGRRRRRVIAVLIVFSLFAGWTMLAYSGALDPLFKQKRKRAGAISIQSFNSNSPSKEYVYAGGRLVATEEPTSGGGCTPPSAPVLTTSIANSKITLNWTIPANTESFEIDRAPNLSGTFQPVAPGLSGGTSTWEDLSVTLSGVNPDGSSAVVTYIYRVVAHIGQCSTPSNLDWATNVSFFEALTPQQTLIKARHITELRVAVNSVWKAANQTPETIIWSEPSSGGPSGLECCSIKKIHIDELRTKLNQAMDAIQPGYSSAHPYNETLLQFSTPIRANHLIELQSRVK